MKKIIFYSRQQKTVLMITALVLIVMLFLKYKLIDIFEDSDSAVKISESIKNDNKEQFGAFLAMLYDSAQYKPKYVQNGQHKVVITPNKFDPNKADSAELRLLGLPGFLVNNIIKYREKGGVFRSKEKLASIYGMKDEYFIKLKDYIVIDSSLTISTKMIDKDSLTNNNRIFAEKFKEVIAININSTDSVTLIKIPGVGPATARAIIEYRDRLGGFYCVNQIDDLEFIADSTKMHINKFAYIDSTEIRKINVNLLSVSALKMHPYINFYQAKCIVDYRKRKYLESIYELKFSEEFSEFDFKRIVPYIDYKTKK